jgi:2-amino-4-hydroxy-6-hydroxymethyldihydropteridine diphosphokinase
LLRTYWPGIRFSSVYRTQAREFEEQPDFLNAVAMIETDQTPEEIHTGLAEIERKLGKAPPFRFGPRTIDLDLLLYGDLVLKEKTLMIPHPRMHERRFVLQPLCELINPVSLHPALGTVWKELLQGTQEQEVRKISLEL